MRKVKGLFPVLLILLCISCISISVGFSALSTSLSINGVALVDPVGMIRITSIEQETISNANEYHSDYSFDSISAQLDIENNGYATYIVEVKNLGEIDEQLSKIDVDIFSNNEMTYEIDGIELGTVIKKRESLQFRVTFKNNNNASDKKLNAKISFKFKKYEKPIINSSEYFQADGECLFSGKGNNVIGECSKGEDIDYINTHITPFSEENYLRNFILKFTITDADLTRFSAKDRDTIFNILYENNDNIGGRYPGVLLRIENGKWLLQGSSGTGSNYSTKLSFSRDELLNKEFKIIRYNNKKGKIALYYVIGDSAPKLLKDITDLYAPFDTPLTFGAILEIDNETANRHSYVNLENILFKYADEYNSLNELVNDEIEEIIIDPPQPQLEQFNLPGPCIFSGSTANITGDACSTYHDSLFINTGIKLFSSENYQKDFELSFDITDYDSNIQEFEQSTLLNAFLERTGKGYGILLRRNRNNLNLIIRDGKGKIKEVEFPYKNVSSLKVVRKNNNICYSINDGDMQFAIDSSNLEAPFDVPVTFGGSIDKEGQPFRYIKGTLSNMKIVVGQVDKDIMCGE